MATITYCTNVHPLGSLSQWKDTISFFGPKIKELLNAPNFPLGLWFNADLIREIWVENRHKSGEIRDLLSSLGLSVFTFNAFPYGNFHQKEVKKKVYSPNWSSSLRADYTLKCGELLALLMEEDHGTLSTLPLAWKGDWKAGDMESSLRNIFRVIQGFKKIGETGKHIQLCLEPEPGCVLEHTSEAIQFWEEHLRPAAPRFGISEAELQQYCGLCYDTCHQAVQFEDPVEALASLIKWGIPVGKIQVSNALQFVPDAGGESIEGRRTFCEEKFLHQTRVLKENGGVQAFDDLPEALSNKDLWRYPWRSHFHLPIFTESEMLSDGIETTRQDMIEAVKYSLQQKMCKHYEIETYTWWVLPQGLRPENNESLAKGIVKEFQSLQTIMEEAKL